MDYLKTATFRARNHGSRIAYSKERDPSPAQIRLRCAVIQQSWSEHDELVRRVFAHSHKWRSESELPVWTPPIVSLTDSDVDGVLLNGEIESE
jgi:hypothetical protein